MGIYYIDSEYLVSRSPYWDLKNRFEHYLREFHSKAIEYQDLLYDYPFIKYEQLDSMYFTIQMRALMDEPLLKDFLKCTWRGELFGCWLVALNPSKEFKDILKSNLEEASRDCIVSKLALEEKAGLDSNVYLQWDEMLESIRGIVNKVYVPRHIKLRRTPTPAELKQLEIEREAIKQKYKSHGLSGALPILRKSKSYSLTCNYADWVNYERGEAS